MYRIIHRTRLFNECDVDLPHRVTADRAVRKQDVVNAEIYPVFLGFVEG